MQEIHPNSSEFFGPTAGVAARAWALRGGERRWSSTGHSMARCGGSHPSTGDTSAYLGEAESGRSAAMALAQVLRRDSSCRVLACDERQNPRVRRIALAVGFAASVVIVGCSDDDEPAAELTQCEGSFVRRVDGGDPPADALPHVDEAPTDRQTAEAAFAEVEAQVRERHGATAVELSDGFGRAWTGVTGDYDVVDVEDFGIVVTLASTEDCPDGGALHEWAAGLPLFFFAP